MGTEDERTLPRREFARHCGLMAVTGMVSGAVATPMVVAADDDPPKPPPPPMLILAQLMQQYPSDRYDETVLEGILSDIQLDLNRGRDLARVPLSNADEPASVFRVVRGDRPPRGAQPLGKPPA
jgi:hypothetical protein